MTGHKVVFTHTDQHLHKCNTIVREQTVYSKAFYMLVGAPLPSDIDWRHFSKAVQRPSLLPKESAEYREWYDDAVQRVS